jgi:hypothetical protein
MTDVQKEESQKTVISFVFGLLIGGLLVWAFMGGNGGDTDKKEVDKKDDVAATSTTDNATTTDENPTEAAKTLPTGDGKVTVSDKKAGRSVGISDTVYPIKEGWIGVREYRDGKLGYINGVIRFSDAGGVVPTTIPLVTPTIAGREYAVVMFTEGGVKGFNGADDKQLDTIFATFKAE